MSDNTAHNNDAQFMPVAEMGDIWHDLTNYLDGLKKIPTDEAQFTKLYGSWDDPAHLSAFLAPVARSVQLGLLINEPGQSMPNPQEDPTKLLVPHFVWCLLHLEASAARFVARLEHFKAGGAGQDPASVKADVDAMIALCQQQQAQHEALEQKISFVGPNLKQQCTLLHGTVLLSDAAQAIGFYSRTAEIKRTKLEELDKKMMVWNREAKKKQLLAEIEQNEKAAQVKQQFLDDVKGISMATFKHISSPDKLLYQLRLLNNWLKLVAYALANGQANAATIPWPTMLKHLDTLQQRWTTIEATCQDTIRTVMAPK